MFLPAAQKNRLPPLFFCFFLAAVFFPPRFAFAQNAAGAQTDQKNAGRRETSRKIFPSLYFTGPADHAPNQEPAAFYWVATEDETLEAGSRNASRDISILLNNDILAFYGHPLSTRMGILGRYSITELDERLSALAEEYGAVNGGRGIRKAFYIIYGTVWPGGDIGILSEKVLTDYIQYALDNDLLVFIDHQIGRFDPVESLKVMLPYLRYPNVHLALDPEWRTTKPMKEIGTVTADEINRAQRVMEDYIIEHELPGERMLVIHQFNWRMIQNREQVLSNFERVRLVHCADGFGNPTIKRASYANNAQATNMPIKGFKLFYNFNIPGAGYDWPILSPKEVYELNPRPYVIMYQ
ncbi:MAG: hypothetical protein LBG76_06185 [Treponema sp.]|jgi:hypothetical protein|nr:hypothetical protein [Treponema sp.]